MTQPMTVVLATLAAQGVGALLGGLVLLGFIRDYQRGYLVQWTRSAFALAVYMIYGCLAMALASEAFGPQEPVQVAVSLVANVAGYVQVAWLLFGTWEISTSAPVPRSRAWALIVPLVALGIVSTLLFAGAPESHVVRFALRLGIRSVVLSAAYAIAAFVVWRVAQRGIGPRLVAVAFFLAALEQLHLATAVGMVTLGVPGFQYAIYLGLVDLLLQVAITLGLVIWLLEDERRATLEASAQIEHLAYHDGLTGLPNRQLLLDRLERVIAAAPRHGGHVAVCFLDLDRFKVINDSLGHSAGDILLRGVAQRLTALLREGDTVARIGGDEFVLIVADLKGVDDAVTVARRVREALQAPVVISGRELVVSASVGISLYPEDGTDAETLLKHADVAMYRAKSEGRDTFQLFTKAMNALALEHLALETAMRRAVAAGELVVHYQPILDFAADGRPERVDAVEALVRWRHPQLGLLHPDQFIPIAEATGIIVDIGHWVMREACAEAVRLRAEGRPKLRVACNLSVRQLQRPDFLSSISEVLVESGLPAEALELEITESVAMQRGDDSLERLRALRQLGVRLSIDDFGTGYSSLSALRLLPVDVLKIDRSFVSGVAGPDAMTAGDTAIARAVIALAHSLGLSVVAEGIETPAQHEFLRAEGCDAWQGYLACRPVPADELRDYLAAPASAIVTG